MVLSWTMNWDWFVYRGLVVHRVVNWNLVLTGSFLCTGVGLVSWSRLMNWSRSGVSFIRNISDVRTFGTFKVGSSIIIVYYGSIMVWSWFSFGFMNRDV